WYDQPANFFEEALPIGNGKLGATIYGSPDDNQIQLNDITLWSGKPVDRDLDNGAYKWLPEIRKALFNENYKLADSLQRHLQGPNSAYYMPLATLHILDDSSGKPTDYYRELNIDSALCKDRYTRNGVTYTREYFLSNPDKVFIIKIKADQPGKLNLSLTLNSEINHKVRASGNRLFMTGHAIGDEQESTHFCSILKVTNKGGQISATGSTLTLKNVDEAMLYFVNETSFNGFDKHPVKQGAAYITNAENDLKAVERLTYEQLREHHIADYQKLFNRFQLRLGKANGSENKLPTNVQLKNYTLNGGGNSYLETLYTQFGRYLLISSSRTKGIPANLQGLWNPLKKAPWRSNYTVNINLEENYWLAEACHLSELTMPLFTLMENLAENGRHTARNYYGIHRGWCSSHNSDIWAMTNPVGEKSENPKWANWNLGFAWLTQSLWEHYAYTMDKDFLRNTAYPLMRGASEFVSDWLIENPKQPGELITAPSTSPENTYMLDGYQGETCYGGTADLAIIRELLHNTLHAADILGINNDLTHELSGKLKRLHPYTIGHEGDLNEWYYDWDDYDIHHRHQSHLIGLYPGHHITLHGTPELAEASRKTLIQKGDRTTGWSTGWRINLWARLHDAQQAYHTYQKLLNYVPAGKNETNYGGGGGTYPNLFDAHPPFQIDGNFGGTAGVCEMLVQSSLHEIELLPALPEQWSEGQVKGIRARGGFVIDMAWSNGKITQATLYSKNGGSTMVKYNGKAKRIKLKKGQNALLK
ncbi:MAG: glycoside hydrolase N-terminal domain-containing protein, partial [Prevotella sp.]